MIKQHTVSGRGCCSRIPFFEDVVPLVRSAHERWDGRGYPDGLAGEDIPLGARIICACDAYNAMITERPYKDAIAARPAVAELARCGGTQFDPAVNQALVLAGTRPPRRRGRGPLHRDRLLRHPGEAAAPLSVEIRADGHRARIHDDPCRGRRAAPRGAVPADPVPDPARARRPRARAVLPAVPDVELEPDLVLVVILPPLLYAAAFFTPLRELRRNVRAISLLAIGLVLATMVGVAVVAHEALDSAGRRRSCSARSSRRPIRSPRPRSPAGSTSRGRIVTIVEGESLINDGTALVAYKFAVAAVVTGSFSLLEASGEFVVSVARRRRGRHRRRRRRRLRPPPASTRRRSRSRSRCSAATSPTCRRRRSASRACWRRSPSASTWDG